MIRHQSNNLKKKKNTKSETENWKHLETVTGKNARKEKKIVFIVAHNNSKLFSLILKYFDFL